MTHRQAMQMRMAINVLFRLTNPDRYCVAIAERMPEMAGRAADYELHLYLRDPKKSGQIQLALLARAIEDLGTHFLTIDTTYDAGTLKESDVRKSVKIW